MQIEYILSQLRAGYRARRMEWDAGSFVYLVPAASYPAQRGPAQQWAGEGAMVPYSEYFARRYVTGLVSPWLPDLRDLLTYDWEIVSD